MHLNDSAFERILNGTKRIELRLYDSKRRKIQVNDQIEFIHAEDPSRHFITSVVELVAKDTFSELLEILTPKELGYSQDEFDHERCIESVRQIYSIQDENTYGVLGIRLELS